MDQSPCEIIIPGMSAPFLQLNMKWQRTSKCSCVGWLMKVVSSHCTTKEESLLSHMPENHSQTETSSPRLAPSSSTVST